MHNFDNRCYYIFASILSVEYELFIHFKREKNMNLYYEFCRGCRFTVAESGSRVSTVVEGEKLGFECNYRI